MSSEDYGRDLTGVQNLRKKHKRLEAELGAHEPAIQVSLLLGWVLMELLPVLVPVDRGPRVLRRTCATAVPQKLPSPLCCSWQAY